MGQADSKISASFFYVSQLADSIKRTISETLTEEPTWSTFGKRTRSEAAIERLLLETPTQNIPWKASTAVFSIPELSEAILTHLKTKDIAAVLQTCRLFYQTVRCSKKLQRKLFLEPSQIQSFLERTVEKPEDYYGTVIRYGSIPTANSSPIVTLNPMFGLSKRIKSDNEIDSYRQSKFLLDVNRLNNMVIRCSTAVADMFVTQPPVSEVEIKYCYMLHLSRGLYRA